MVRWLVQHNSVANVRVNVLHHDDLTDTLD